MDFPFKIGVETRWSASGEVFFNIIIPWVLPSVFSIFDSRLTISVEKLSSPANSRISPSFKRRFSQEAMAMVTTRFRHSVWDGDWGKKGQGWGWWGQQKSTKQVLKITRVVKMKDLFLLHCHANTQKTLQMENAHYRKYFFLMLHIQCQIRNFFS